MNPKVAAFELRRLPKAELHCHIDGVIGPSLLDDLDTRGITHRISRRELERLWPTGTLDTWVEYLSLLDSHIQNNGRFLLEVLRSYVTGLKRDGVVYSEMFLSSFLQQYRDLEQQMDLFGECRRVADELEVGGLQIELLICIGRTPDAAKFARKAERALMAYERGFVVGVAVGGEEDAMTIRDQRDWFDEFHRQDRGVEIHAGEWRGPSSVWDALEYGRPQRLGHGLAAFHDEALLKYIKDRGVHLEFCPTSNIVLTDLPALELHPMQRALDEGISFSLNTYDPGPLGITMGSEFQLVADTFSWGQAEFDLIRQRSLDASFAKGWRFPVDY